MQTKSLNYYKESGIALPINLGLSILISSLLIIPFSYLYSLAITFLPFIYFNIVIVVVYGYVIAFISNFINSLLKIRNRKKSIIAVLIVALISIYSQWVSYIYILFSEQVDLFFNIDIYLDFFINPILLVKDIIMLNELGSWEMFSIIFKGTPLLLIWVSEILITLFSTYFVMVYLKPKPFSETDNNWFKKNVFEMEFDAIKLRKDFIKEYTENPFEAINNLGSGNGIRYSKINIYTSKSENKNLLSIDNVMITERGEGKKNIEEIIAPHYVDSNYIVQLKQKFKVKKKSAFDFFFDLYS